MTEKEKKEIIDLVHKTIFDFFEFSPEDRAFTQTEAILFKVNKALCGKINEIPTEERPQGEWEWQTEDKYRCTNCGEVVRVKEVMNVPQYNFCPMCSADMRKSLASYE